MAWSFDRSGSFGGGGIILCSEISENANNKVLDVADVGQGPSGLLITGIRVEYDATVTIGTRLFAVTLEDAAGTVLYKQIINPSLGVISLGSQNFDMVPGATFSDDPLDAREFLPMDMWVKEGWFLRVFDTVNVDSADDMKLFIRMKLGT